MRERFIYDNEADGLLDQLTRLHCLVLYDLDTNELLSFADQPGYRPIAEGINLLALAKERIGHNIIRFDERANRKVFPSFPANVGGGVVMDTLLAARLLWGDLFDTDEKRVEAGKLPGKLRGAHSLEAWGYRLGVWKGDFSAVKAAALREQFPDLPKEEITRLVWAEWSKEMQDYCEQDVRTTLRLYQAILKKGLPPQAWADETEAALLCARIEDNGFPFHADKAAELYAELCGIRSTIEQQLKDTFGCWWVNLGEYTPKTSNSATGYWGETWFEFTSGEREGERVPDELLTRAGKPSSRALAIGMTARRFQGFTCTKVELVRFNPGSRHHVANRLKALYGWEPTEFTDGGDPKIDDEILAAMPYPEAKLLADYYLVVKRIGQIAEGDQAWLKLMQNGRIHGGYNTLGAVTRRATHSKPNIGQVPKVQKIKEKVNGESVERILYGQEGGWGYECRALFHPGKGWFQVGTDASGLELRCLAHFMFRWDKGAYAEVILNGDIHRVNMEAAGLKSRDQAKTFIYALLYGAGDAKIGSIIGGTASDGKRLKKQFFAAIPALQGLAKAVQAAVKQHGNVKALDDAFLHCRKPHAALNTLLQSAGALICKKWIVTLEKMLLARGYKHGWDGDFAFMAWVHDEVQVAARTREIAELIKVLSKEAMKEAEANYGFTCPLDTSADIGFSWAECH